MIDHDRLFKELLTTFFAEFMQLFIPELYDCLDVSSLVFLDKEVFTDVTSGGAHEADLVARAKIRGSESYILVHTETQSRAQKLFPRRMFQYFARLHERHDLPVYPVVVYSFDRPRAQQPSVYSLQLPGLNVLTFQYRVIQLNSLHWKDYLRQQNPIAAALMAKMQFAGNERFRVKLECLRMIVTLKLNRAKTRLIAGFVDSYLELADLEQNAFDAAVEMLEGPQKEDVMEIVTSWEKKGIKLGMQQGLQQGRAEEASMLVIRLLKRRFGNLDDAVMERIRVLPLERLEQLAEDLLDFKTVDDTEAWLSNN